MPAKTNTEVFRTLIEDGFGRGHVEVVDDCLAPSCVEHQYGMPSTPDGLKQVITSLRRGFPDLKHTIDEMIVHEDKVWARMTGRGTHLGAFMGVEPTGKPFSITVIDVCRFENGKIVEHWGVPDRFALMHQLGLLPAPPPKPAA